MTRSVSSSLARAIPLKPSCLQDAQSLRASLNPTSRISGTAARRSPDAPNPPDALPDRSSAKGPQSGAAPRARTDPSRLATKAGHGRDVQPPDGGRARDRHSRTLLPVVAPARAGGGRKSLRDGTLRASRRSARRRALQSRVDRVLTSPATHPMLLRAHRRRTAVPGSEGRPCRDRGNGLLASPPGRASLEDQGVQRTPERAARRPRRDPRDL